MLLSAFWRIGHEIMELVAWFYIPESDGLTQVWCVFALLQEDAIVNVLQQTESSNCSLH